MSFSWRKIVSTIAPVIGTALGGPLGGVAVNTITKALGISDASDDNLQSEINNLTPDKIRILQEADKKFALEMEKLKIDVYKLDNEDRKNARDRQIKLDSKTPDILAFLLTICFVGILITLIFVHVSHETSAVIDILLGSLGTAWISCITYFFGSSSGSRLKDLK